MGVPVDLFSGKRILTVTQLTSLVTGVLEENFDHVWVEGEVSNLAIPNSGHLYFTLKDSTAQIRIVMFRASARNLKFQLRDGMSLIVRGRISVFPQRGEYQLISEYMEPKGIGALQLAFIQLKDRLSQEGLFSESKKKPIPTLPRRVGIVTSPTGAAIHDILTVLDRRFSNIHVILNPVKVQGEGAAVEIASAIRDFNRLGNVDVMIVGRGGGSIEDLWAFNEEVVARAIHDSSIPIISAVGHEVDITIADLAADLRAPTPSAAAELVISSKAELSETLAVYLHRLDRAIGIRMREYRGRVRLLASGLRDPSHLLGALLQQNDYLQERLVSSIKKLLEIHEQKTESLSARLDRENPQFLLEMHRERVRQLDERHQRAIRGRFDKMAEAAALRAMALEKLSPLATFSRGYSMVCRADNQRLITDSAQIGINERVDIRFSRGSARCLVEQTDAGANP